MKKLFTIVLLVSLVCGALFAQAIYENPEGMKKIIILNNAFVTFFYNSWKNIIIGYWCYLTSFQDNESFCCLLGRCFNSKVNLFDITVEKQLYLVGRSICWIFDNRSSFI